MAWLESEGAAGAKCLRSAPLDRPGSIRALSFSLLDLTGWPKTLILQELVKRHEDDRGLIWRNAL